MRLATFTHGGTTRAGVVVDDEVVDLGPSEMTALLAAGLERVAEAAAKTRARLPLQSVRLEAPVLRPPKFLAVGLNYADHVAESGAERPALPTFFNKQSTCVTGPYDPIHRPRVSPLLDYEGELGFVIGRRCRHVPRARAAEAIAGWVVLNDVTVRDWQLRVPTWTMGKSFDTHGPMGPWIVTADELGDPHALRLRTWVNGELRQDATTADLIFGIDELVAFLSETHTLSPGDLILTGTPAGVGVAMDPPQFLQTGDVVRIEVEGLGWIEHAVEAAPEPSTPSAARSRGR